MYKSFIHFIKYNNLTVLIVLAIFLISGGAFAASPTGQDIIGSEQTRLEGMDSTLLLAADLDNLAMDFKIEKIEQDQDFYYITYTFIDLTILENAWQYQLKERIKKVSKNLDQDLGVYLAGEFKEEYDARIRDLKEEKEKARNSGEQTRFEITEYSGLIGQTLDLAAKVFPGYEPVKKEELPSPEILTPPTPPLQGGQTGQTAGPADNLTDIYNDFITLNDPDLDSVFAGADNCPNVFNPDQIDTDADGIGDVCDDINYVDNSQPAVDNSAAMTPEIIEPVSPPASENATSTESLPPAITEPENVQVIEIPAPAPETAPII